MPERGDGTPVLEPEDGLRGNAEVGVIGLGKWRRPNGLKRLAQVIEEGAVYRNSMQAVRRAALIQRRQS